MKQSGASDPKPVQMRIAIVVRAALAAWQRLNVAAFLASAVASSCPESVGQPYQGAGGRAFPRMFALPVMVFEASGPALERIFAEALDNGLQAMAFPERLFSTDNDADNRAAFAALPPAQMEPAGVALYGGRNRIAKLLASARKHP
jgi:hypothetical protein